jgi:hypothetical protein
MGKNRPIPYSEPRNPNLLLPRSDAETKITAQIEKGRQILQSYRSGQASDTDTKLEKDRWSKYNLTLLRSLFSDPTSFEREYEQAGYAAMVGRARASSWIDARRGFRPQQPEDTTDKEISAFINILESIRDRLDLIPEAPETLIPPHQASTPEIDLLRVCERFPLVVSQLQRRHDGRQPFAVNDEYDVQDLVHALLRLFYDDIRPEEWTPSYAGGAAKMDFLIRGIDTVVETKKTRPSMSTRDLGEQLIIDIAKYRNHPCCKNLVCLVFDPEHRIANPRGVESDLSHFSDGMSVKVVIVPRE